MRTYVLSVSPYQKELQKQDFYESGLKTRTIVIEQKYRIPIEDPIALKITIQRKKTC